jgi:hypothetical protein
MHSPDHRLWLVNQDHARRIGEAAEHRLGRTARHHARGSSIRRSVGRSLIRLGHALAAEPDPMLQPARPR